MGLNGYTPVERKLLDLLEDEAPHTKEELWDCLGGNDGKETSTLTVHITNLRKKLRTHGHDVTCQHATATHPTQYILVRLVGSGGDGRR